MKYKVSLSFSKEQWMWLKEQMVSEHKTMTQILYEVIDVARRNRKLKYAS